MRCYIAVIILRTTADVKHVPLHPEAEAFLQWITNARIPAVSMLSSNDARKWDVKVTNLLTTSKESVGNVQDVQVVGPCGGIPVRIYTPNVNPNYELLLYFHGGGWVLGSIELSDQACRILANETGRTVFSVGYRLAPEFKFPAAPEDCYVATQWVAEHAESFGGNSKQLAVCGASAGGNLAAVVSLMAKNRGTPPIANQVLIYPVTDLADQRFLDFPDELSPALTRADMGWFIRHYISGDANLTNPYASPLLQDDLRGLPPTLLITAEYDILTKQCNDYAEKLRKAGVHVTSVDYAGLVHGFVSLPEAFDEAHGAMKQIANHLSHR